MFTLYVMDRGDSLLPLTYWVSRHSLVGRC